MHEIDTLNEPVGIIDDVLVVDGVVVVVGLTNGLVTTTQ